MVKPAPFILNLCQCCASLGILGEHCDCAEGDHVTDLLSQVIGCRIAYAEDNTAIGEYVCDGCLTVSDRWTLKAEVLFD